MGQNIVLENRERLSVTGVIEVESFNEGCVVANTELGLLIVKGAKLHVSKLNIESAELGVEGSIASCEYSSKEASRSKGSFFARVFR